VLLLSAALAPSPAAGARSITDGQVSAIPAGRSSRMNPSRRAASGSMLGDACP
jgi:hypothetical protein